MDIFESLENLNVSEECFEDIINIVEKLLQEGYAKPLNYWTHIERVHGAPKYDENTGKPLNTSAKLMDKNSEIRSKEIDDAITREGREHAEIFNKRNINKRDEGDSETAINQWRNKGIIP